MERRYQKLCSEGHVLAIARWEDNHNNWLEGNYLGLISKKPLCWLLTSSKEYVVIFVFEKWFRLL